YSRYHLFKRAGTFQLEQRLAAGLIGNFYHHPGKTTGNSHGINYSTENDLVCLGPEHGRDLGLAHRLENIFMRAMGWYLMKEVSTGRPDESIGGPIVYLDA